MAPRLKERYRRDVVPALVKEFKYRNAMAVPRLRKIVVNMGLGEAIQNAKLLDPASRELAQITGQKPVITRARKSIANFKLRKNMPIGAMVTLRGDRISGVCQRGRLTVAAITPSVCETSWYFPKSTMPGLRK